jgi:large subunit ribosomal protein L27e
MSKKKVEKRCKTMKPFVKYINVRHVFPTRYVVDMDLKKAVDEADLVGEKKVEVKKNLKKIFEERYINQKQITSEKKAAGSTYFFQKLRF